MIDGTSRLEASTTTPEERAALLDALYARCVESARLSIGYPSNFDFDYGAVERFLRFSLNNIGDPFASSHHGLHTHELERHVIDWFAARTGAPHDDCWGYVTSGGTEGNLWALAMAREHLPGAVVYASQASHYSIEKLLRLLALPAVRVAARADGQMDLGDFRTQLRAGCRAGHTRAIVIVNVGTTMTGATDDLLGMRRVLAEAPLEDAHLHADAALSGMILPFVDDAPPWRFPDGIDSIAVSGHKMIGTPMPCGIVLARRSRIVPLSHTGTYVKDLRDTTIAGSRSGLGALYLWHAIESLGAAGFRARTDVALAHADWLTSALRRHGVEAFRHRHSITVCFPAPPPALRSRWCLPVSDGLSHVVTVPHVTRDKLERFVHELVGARAQPAPAPHAMV